MLPTNRRAVELLVRGSLFSLIISSYYSNSNLLHNAHAAVQCARYSNIHPLQLRLWFYIIQGLANAH
jgi:hypothetical protein